MQLINILFITSILSLTECNTSIKDSLLENQYIVDDDKKIEDDESKDIEDYKKMLFSNIADSMLSSNLNITITKKNLIRIIKQHYDEHYDDSKVYDEQLSSIEEDLKTRGEKELTQILLDILIGPYSTIDILKIDSKYIQIYSQQGSGSSNSYSMYEYDDDTKQYHKIDIEGKYDYYIKALIKKTSKNFNSAYSIKGAKIELINGRKYFVSNVFIDEDPMCCPSYNLDIDLDESKYYEFAYLSKINSNGGNTQWVKFKE